MTDPKPSSGSEKSYPETISSDPQILTHIQNYHSLLLPRSPIYAFLLSDVSIVHASRGLVRVHLPLSKLHLNSKNSLHGSVSATLVDYIGGLAVASWDSRDSSGVSTDMHLNFVGGAKEGDVIEVEGKAEKVGGSLAFVSVRIVNLGKDGKGERKVVVVGRHTKFVKV
ncbi:thioesterase family protein [Patellaria atrata CBS 101060]|uniref:Thioesterase family protein n=1 Tax=Patellaria atrata CBS 101060 TaxID=1346257 RepID=A0A9P4S423_9PEZI|nr:thioesterase family protein [Patellaria atrata CBS 101060]